MNKPALGGHRVNRTVRVTFALALVALTGCDQAGPSATPATLEKFLVEVPGTEFPTHTALQLRALAFYSDGTKVNVTNETQWATLDSNVGVVGASGITQLNGVGEARFEGAFGGHRALVNIMVTGATLESLSVSSPEAGELAQGDTRRFRARAGFSDGSFLDVTEHTTWLTEGQTLAMTDAAGVVLGRARGPGQLRAIYFSHQQTLNLEVTRPRFEALTLSPPSVALHPGVPHRLVLTATFSDGSRRDVGEFAAWASSDSNVADLSTSPGVLFPRAEGRARLTASWNGAKASIEVTVQARPIARVSFGLDELHLAQGHTGGFDLLAWFDDGSHLVVTPAASWASSDPSVAQVTSAGEVVTTAMGLTTITAQYAGFQASYDVLVTAPVLMRLDATLSEARLVLGQSANFIVLGTFSDGAVLNLTSVATLRAGSKVSSEHTGDRLTITAASVGLEQLEFTVGGWSHQLTFEVSAANLVGLEVREYPQRPWNGPGPAMTAPLRFVAVATYDDGEQLDVTELCTWSVDDASLANVSDVPGSRGVSEFALGGQTNVRAVMAQLPSTLAWDFPPGI